MNTDAFIEKVSLFYYFSFLDESKAQSAAARTIKEIRQENLTKDLSEEGPSAADFVRVTEEFMRKSSRDVKPTTLVFSVDHILLPDKSNFGPWFEFRKIANEKDFRALLYNKILNISEEDIAEGLKLPLGTVRYRLGRALKTLGRICHMGERDGEHGA